MAPRHRYAGGILSIVLKNERKAGTEISRVGIFIEKGRKIEIKRRYAEGVGAEAEESGRQKQKDRAKYKESDRKGKRYNVESGQTWEAWENNTK